ncbi:MAG TPA: hypothetical protein PLN53_11150 [Terricaulis sp.]|jgi:hypothetical protein|nr:hypothetical protein [Terricaulis sp.]
MRALLLAVFALAACAATPPASGGSELAQQIRADLDNIERELRMPGTASAGFNETADLGGGLTVRPIEVKEDSRCAGNVTCFWEGRLVVRADVSGTERDLTLGQTLETPQGTVVFAVARPGAWAEWPESEVARPAYRFGFRRG